MRILRGIYQILGRARPPLGEPERNFRYTSARQGALEHLFSFEESGWTLSLKSLA